MLTKFNINDKIWSNPKTVSCETYCNMSLLAHTLKACGDILQYFPGSRTQRNP